jgi:hypothetical protein
MVEKLLTIVKSEEHDTNQAMDFGYVTGEATKPWQIVLIPLDDQKIIRVEGYAESLDKPFITEEIPVPTY